MEELLELLKDGNARTVMLLAKELHTSVSDVERQLEYMENMGIIRRVNFSACNSGHCGNCPSHDNGTGHTCKGCLPENGFRNMGEMWEVIL